ncbi:plastocyanin/azurin family copper-binding protein [Akkermansiaceae bacterium]|nr:plastocyanin/azurin family copper-binding protein [Akkermansiaceae bacterium]
MFSAPRFVNISIFMKHLAAGLFLVLSSALASASDPVDARYVRITLKGKNRILTLAEVEVFVDGKNIARSGKARQSSVAADGTADRAIDGNKSSRYNDKGQTHTAEKGKNAWWEVDLGKSVSIEKINVWNRGDNLGNRLEGFSLILLDADRKKAFISDQLTAPDPLISINYREAGALSYLDAQGNEKKIKGQVNVPADYRDPSPFKFQKGDTISIIGSGLAERMQHDGWLETLIQSETSGMELSFRNMSLSGDRANKYPRSKGFTPMPAYLQQVGADVIIAMFGYNESFDVTAENYTKELTTLVKNLRAAQPNGESFPRIILTSPIAHENLNDKNLPNGRANNKRLLAITEATRLAAEQNGVAFLDLYNPSLELYSASQIPLTLNGIHLNQDGNRMIAEVIAKDLLKKEISASPSHQFLRAAVTDKNWHWYNRYRATDGNDVWGSRSGLKFVDGQSNGEVLVHELDMLDVSTANRDQKIQALAAGKTYKVDDSNVPAPVKVISNVGGGSRSSSAAKEGSLKYLDGKEAISKMTMPKGFKVNLFADEKKFPEMANPVQMQLDTKGRLWAACWPTYPKWEPMKEMNDSLLIFHDDDQDGVADRTTEFAKIHNPLGFEFWNGGVIVTSQPDIVFLKDTDGDDVADVRYVLLSGVGSSDTHHAANNLIFGPDGGIYWQSGIFLHHNHESPWGPSLSTGASGMYRFDPRRFTISFHAKNSPNPHGISFDQWGYHYANDGTGGRSYQVRPDGQGFKMFPLVDKEVRPVAADEIISSSHFPEEMQQNFILCNTIGYLGLKQYKLHRDGFPDKNYKQGEVWGTPTDELLFSSDGNFRPTDAIFGSDGALYVSDWHNVIIGHMQHNVRDPNRDKKHGRIYRMTHEGSPLQKPIVIDGAPITALLENFKHPVLNVRHRTRVEISERDTAEVIAATQKWIKQFDPAKKEDGIPLLEALWVHQQHNVKNIDLLAKVLTSADPHVAIGAATVKHFWEVADPILGVQEIEEEKEMHLKKGGIESNTAELTTVRVNAIVEKISFDVKNFNLKAGKKVKLIFVNPDFMPHNLVIVKPGTADAVGNSAIALGAEGFKKAWLPESADILHASRLLEKGETQELEFTAPTTPGDYQFICTFPGHAGIMRGTIHVK